MAYNKQLTLWLVGAAGIFLVVYILTELMTG